MQMQAQMMQLPVYNSRGRHYLTGETLSSAGYHSLVTGGKDQFYEVTDEIIRDVMKYYEEYYSYSTVVEPKYSQMTAEDISLIAGQVERKPRVTQEDWDAVLGPREPQDNRYNRNTDYSLSEADMDPRIRR